MTYRNIRLKGIEIYHPKNKVHNSFFIKHFDKEAEKVEKLMEHLGREYRYFGDLNEENALTLAVESSKKVMKAANICPEELDMIVFASDTPEYTFPSNALKINNEIKAKNAHLVYDMNSNCIGMLTAMDVVSRYMKSNNNIKKALVVGSLMISSVIDKNDDLTYPTFADGSAAIILEAVEENESRGFIDSNTFTDSNYHNSFLNPLCGLSKLHKNDVQSRAKQLLWSPFDFSFLATNWKKVITEMLDRYSLQPEEIGHFLFSQFSKPDVEETLKKMNVGLDKYTFVGNEYGYTGVSSPFFALHRALKDNKIKENDYVVFCSVGAGYTMTSILYKF
ncbi:ketoacyl-ACP synthase III [Clostridium brassicae]|uniref:Ketoacyl-ACP synthase III n=1 Tax=Clostridium brassicae TaxID=2999072 RepID=A0ABT4D7N4_9CLOT|nr:ketoacyl-ACP synthase III [Clostridium brassicae]MCY6957261.1 ketoacyl-ACP synthase III [Clostridium brassicae]